MTTTHCRKCMNPYQVGETTELDGYKVCYSPCCKMVHYLRKLNKK